jgi:hypothetical protein
MYLLDFYALMRQAIEANLLEMEALLRVDTQPTVRYAVQA